LTKERSTQSLNFRADSSPSESGDIPADSNGLSDFGKLVVKEMNRLGKYHTKMGSTFMNIDFYFFFFCNPDMNINWDSSTTGS
jgi:hypothetical protein